MLRSLNESDPPPRVEQLEEDEFLSSVAVIACIALLLFVVVMLALFTRLGGM
jgi:hypothetical protein